MPKARGPAKARSLEGSSQSNPWCFVDGELFLERPPLVDRNAVLNEVVPPHPTPAKVAPELRINKGPPSTIPKSLRGPAVQDGTSASAPLPSGVLSTAFVPETSASAIVRERRSKPSVAELGKRVARAQRLTRADLYLSERRPPLLKNPRPHHLCGLCGTVKSHPVSYRCGHSHCYVCIRVWLEKHWTCPECTVTMTTPPFRHQGEEDSLDFDYPCWDDHSRVSFSWDGLTFPTRV